MQLLIVTDDVLLDSTYYYDTLLYFYGKVVAEYTDQVITFKAGNCPMRKTLLELAQGMLNEDTKRFQPWLVQAVNHLYDSWTQRFVMNGFIDTGSALGELVNNDIPITLLVPGDPDLTRPSIEKHELHENFPVIYSEVLNKDVLAKVLRENRFSPEDTFFVGSSPRRELNWALELGLQTARINYRTESPDFDQPLTQPVPTFDTLGDFALTYLEIVKND